MITSCSVRMIYSFRVAAFLAITGGAGFSSAVEITFENPPYVGGTVVGQDGWVTNDYVGAGLNGDVLISNTAPLAGAQSLIYNQTSLPSGFAAADVSKPEVIAIAPGIAGVDLTVTYLLSASGNAQSPSGVAGLFLSHDAAGGASPMFARLDGSTMVASDTGTSVTIPEFTYFAGDVLEVKYELDFDASNYILSVNNMTTGQFEFQQTLGYLAPFVPEGPNGEYLIDVGLMLRGGTAQFDSIKLEAGVGPVIEEFEWAGDRSGNWGTPINWAPGGVPGSSPGRQTAIFGDTITSTQTIFTNSSRSLNEIQFNNANSYVISGPGSIDLKADTSGGAPILPTVQVTSGHHQIQVRVNLVDDATVTAAPGASLTFNNQIDLGGNTLTTNGTININHSIIGGGTIVGSGTLAALGAVDIAGNLESTGTLLVDVGQSGADYFHVLGDATLAGILDVVLDGNTVPTGPLTILSAGGSLDASRLSLDASDADLFELSTNGGNLMLNYVGVAVPEPASCGLALITLVCMLWLRPSRSAARNGLVIAALLCGVATVQFAAAATYDFENPPFTTGNLDGQNGFITPAYVLADPFFGGEVNGTVDVTATDPLSGTQSVSYNQTIVPTGAGASGASDVGKPFSVFAVEDGTDAVDITASFLINANSNSVGSGQAGFFLGQGGRSPIIMLLSGTGDILVGHEGGLPDFGDYVAGDTYEFAIGVDLDNQNYEVSSRNVTTGGTLTPLPGPLAGNRFAFFGGGIGDDGDGQTYTLDSTFLFRSGTAKVDNLNVVGDDFVRAVWDANASGSWHANANWIPRMIPGVETPGRQIAVFGDLITSPQTVFTNSLVSVNGVEFDNDTSVVIGGPGAIELRANTIGGTVNPTINVLGGNHEFQTPVTITDNTTITVADGASLDFNNTVNLGGNTLTTSGAVDLNVGLTGGGTIANSGSLGTAGTTPIAANLNSSSKLVIDLGPNNTDFFNITGNATLSGLLDVVLEPGFTPVGPFTVLTVSGTLNATSLALDASDTSDFTLGVVGKSLVLTVGGTGGVTGDYNGNGVVDAADYTLWRDNLGTNNPLQNDDIGGTIGQAHYAQWKSNFGATGGGGSLAAQSAVPEPTTLVFAGLVAFVGCGATRSIRRARDFFRS